MEYFGLAGIMLALALLMYFAYRGISLLIIAPLLAIFVALLNGYPAFPAYTITFMTSFGNYIKSNFPVFMIGALFGKFMDVSGNAQSIARVIIRKFGKDRAILSVVLATAVLIYGGVSVFVISFCIYPIAASMFRQADIPKRLIPGTIVAGAFTFASYGLPGSPQIQNALFMPVYGTTLYAAPVLGIIAAIIEFVLSILWLNWRLKKAREAGEGYGSHVESLVQADEASLPGFGIAIAPIILFIVLNLFLTYIFLPKLDLSFLSDFNTKASSVIGTWSLFSATAIAILFIIIVNLKKFRGALGRYLGEGAFNGVTPIINTSAVVGFGGVVSATAGFLIVRTLLLGISDNPIIAEVLSINVLCGITGSGSGGISITLNTFGQQFIEMAKNSGVSLEVLHRIGAVAAGALDSLPHNGGIITILAVCGLTHKESYKIWALRQ